VARLTENQSYPKVITELKKSGELEPVPLPTRPIPEQHSGECYCVEPAKSLATGGVDFLERETGLESAYTYTRLCTAIATY
jgi:hypothetical protein